MWATLRAVCLRPTAAFSEMDDEPALGAPVAIVVGQGVVAISVILLPALARYNHLVMSSPPVQLSTGAGTVSLPRLWVRYMVHGILQPLQHWLRVAAALFLIGTVLGALAASRDGDPDAGSARAAADDSLVAAATGRLRTFRRTAAFVGWGFAPQFLAYLVTGSIVVAFAALGVELTDAAAYVTPANHPVGHAADYPAVTRVTHAVGALCTLWSGYVWIGAVAVGCDVSRRVAAAAVAPVTVALIYVSDVLHAHPPV